jgi:uncharacterized Zn-finger protein
LENCGILQTWSSGCALRRSLLLGIEGRRRYGAAEREGATDAPGKVQGSYRMSDEIVPHFHNDAGVAVIEIGAKKFMCVGAKPPFDHPHVFCDMGDDTEYVCPYCSTLYRYDPTLAPDAARPEECALHNVAV